VNDRLLPLALLAGLLLLVGLALVRLWEWVAVAVGAVFSG